jgi:hypothetical protein
MQQIIGVVPAFSGWVVVGPQGESIGPVVMWAVVNETGMVSGAEARQALRPVCMLTGKDQLGIVAGGRIVFVDDAPRVSAELRAKAGLQ